MKRTGIILLFSIICIFAESPTGFRDINFGESYATAKAKIDAVKLQTNPKLREPNRTYDENKMITIEYYPLGKIPVDVYLYFSDGVFSSFTVYSKKTFGSKEFNVSLKNEALLFSQILQSKYGEPSEKNDPTILDVEDEKPAFFWVWNLPEHFIASIVRVSNYSYFTYFTVSNKARMNKEAQNDKSKQKLKVENAAGSF